MMTSFVRGDFLQKGIVAHAQIITPRDEFNMQGGCCRKAGAKIRASLCRVVQGLWALLAGSILLGGPLWIWCSSCLA